MRAELCLCACLVAVLSGCVAPLAETSYPALDAATFVGVWSVDTLDEGEVDASVRALVSDASARSRDDESRAFFDPRPEVRDSRIRIALEVPDWEGEEDPTLDGEVLVSGERWYLTVQESPFAVSQAYGVTSAPLQMTLRLEREGDGLLVLAHPTMLVWTPVPIAVEDARLDASMIQGEGRWLIAHFDDIIAYYDERADDEWSAVARLTRIGF